MKAALFASKEHNSWHCMKQRCLNPDNNAYHRYGGAGISVCPEWVDSFETFLRDVGPAPSKHHSLDRIDSTGNYNPSNCRWATPREQADNRSTTIRVKYNGEMRSLTPLCREIGVDFQIIRPLLRKNKSKDFLDALDLYRRHHSPLKMASARVLRQDKWHNTSLIEITGPVGKRCKNLVGKRYGKVVVVQMLGVTSYKCPVVECDCDCGRKGLRRLGWSLRDGYGHSCGCEPDRWDWDRGTRTHGMSHTNEYKIWVGIVGRCTNEKDKSYAEYGGRGITIDARWRESFEAFYRDIGPRPSKKHQVNRIDNDGPYSKANCEWASQKEQANNTRRTVFVEYDGKTEALTLLCERLGLDQLTVRRRINRGTTGPDLFLPTRKNKKCLPVHILSSVLDGDD